MTTVTTATRKIGRNRGKPRLWIEGNLLVEAGLDHGKRWDLLPIPGGFTIRENPEGKRKIAGKPGRPIIDIAGSTLGEIGDVREVALCYRPGFGLVVVKAEVDRLSAWQIAAEAA